MSDNYLQKNVLDMIFPHQCICGRWGEPICNKCHKKILINKKQLCPICKKISDNGKTCKVCRHKSNLTGVLIMSDHEGMIKKTLWRYKYNFVRDLSKPLANLLATKFDAFLAIKKPLITYVPMTKNRLSWRGFNQSELLAEELSNITGLDFIDTLIRKSAKKPQVGLKRKERMKNIKNQIELKKNANMKLNNKIILIVDDVYTTGATLEECSKALRGLGVREVWGMVLTRD